MIVILHVRIAVTEARVQRIPFVISGQTSVIVGPMIEHDTA